MYVCMYACCVCVCEENQPTEAANSDQRWQRDKDKLVKSL